MLKEEKTCGSWPFVTAQAIRTVSSVRVDKSNDGNNIKQLTRRSKFIKVMEISIARNLQFLFYHLYCANKKNCCCFEIQLCLQSGCHSLLLNYLSMLYIHH